MVPLISRLPCDIFCTWNLIHYLATEATQTRIQDWKRVRFRGAGGPKWHLGLISHQSSSIRINILLQLLQSGSCLSHLLCRCPRCKHHLQRQHHLCHSAGIVSCAISPPSFASLRPETTWTFANLPLPPGTTWPETLRCSKLFPTRLASHQVDLTCRIGDNLIVPEYTECKKNKEVIFPA